MALPSAYPFPPDLIRKNYINDFIDNPYICISLHKKPTYKFYFQNIFIGIIKLKKKLYLGCRIAEE